jgi:GDP-mannose 6-dehydrogenase
VNNCFHALKVGFANEIGNLCQAFGIDSHEVMDIFCRDHKLNISPTYLKPGFAFGGSCLTKDLRAVTRRARELDIPTPILEAIMPSNELQIRKGLEMVLDTGRRNVGILGLSFKSGTDDLRGSPHVVLIEGLIGKGLNVRIYDRYVVTARLLGANKAYIEERIPHIANLMYEDIEQVIDESDVIVVGNRDEEFVGALARIGSRDKIVIDLARVMPDFRRDRRYRGICW